MAAKKTHLNSMVKIFSAADKGKHDLNAGENRRVITKVCKLVTENKDFAASMAGYILESKSGK